MIALHPLGFNQVIIAFLLYFFSFDNYAHCLDIVWSKEPLFLLFYFPSLFFNLWFDYSFFSFLFFFFLFFWRTSLTQGKRSFSSKILLFFLPRIRLEISILGQGYDQKVDVWLKRPTNGGTWFMSGYLFSKWLRNKGTPQIISMKRIFW